MTFAPLFSKFAPASLTVRSLWLPSLVAMIAPEIASELDRVLESSSKRLLAISEESAEKRPSPESWCKKEILGHPIDSASNNHQRFVRLQLAPSLVMPAYEQNGWVRSQNYAGRPWR